MKFLILLALAAQIGYQRVPEPLILDVSGNGLSLTSAQDGVRFDLDADGKPEQTAWTARGSDDAFLVTDQNHNGWIDNGHELLGGGRIGPPGFVALREEFDSRSGELDGGLTVKDQGFSRLLLWTDANHNGRSEEDELESLGHAGVTSIALGYRGVDEPDAHGNMRTLEALTLISNGKGAQRRAILSAVKLMR